MNAKRWLPRILAAAFLVLMLGGPTPGNVGGCGVDSEARGVTASAHCLEKQFWQCARDEAAGRLDAMEFQLCNEAVGPGCAGAAFPFGCMPTQEQADDCYDLLRRSDLLHLTNEELLSTHTECNLCM
jgi:hypothetical protein